MKSSNHFNLRAREGWVKKKIRPRLPQPQERAKLPIVQEAVWDPETVWAIWRRENMLPPSGFEPRTTQSETSFQTDYIILTRNLKVIKRILLSSRLLKQEKSLLNQLMSLHQAQVLVGMGHSAAQLFEALRSNSEIRGFDSWQSFSLT